MIGYPGILFYKKIGFDLAFFTSPFSTPHVKSAIYNSQKTTLSEINEMKKMAEMMAQR